MSIYTLTVFATVAEYKSFIKAAADLNLTPSAVSHAISGLEKEFGFPLFIRNKSGAVLTQNAAHLLPFVRNLLADNEKLTQEVGHIHQLKTGTVRLGVFHSVCVGWIPGILKTFSENNPDIKVKIHRGVYTEMLSMLEDNVIDLAFTVRTAHGDFDFLPLKTEPMVCVTPKDFIPENKRYITLEEINKNKLFVQEMSGLYEAEEYVRKYKLKVFSYLNIDDDNMMLALADKGIGISIVPEMTTHNANYKIGVYPLEHELTRTIGLISARSKYLSPAVSLMRSTIREYVSKL